LYNFVQQFRQTHKGKFTWEKARMAWNHSGQGRTYVGYQSVRRAYDKIRDFVEGDVLFPKYRVFETPPSASGQPKSVRHKRGAKPKTAARPKQGSAR